MDLTDRGRGERVRIEGGEEFAERSSETSLDLSDDLFGGDRGNTIAEQGKFSDVVRWQEIVAGRQDLSELDEGWPEFLEGEAETDWSWELWSSRSAAESGRNGGSEVIEQPPQSMLGEDAGDLEYSPAMREHSTWKEQSWCYHCPMCLLRTRPGMASSRQYNRGSEKHSGGERWCIRCDAWNAGHAIPG